VRAGYEIEAATWQQRCGECGAEVRAGEECGNGFVVRLASQVICIGCLEVFEEEEEAAEETRTAMMTTIDEPQWNTTCLDCGVEGQLEIYSATVTCRGMYLSGDGFSLADAKDIDTDNERVRCTACNSDWDLAFLAL
jgi:hypothetical protein